MDCPVLIITESVGVFTRCVSVLGEVIDKEFVGDYTSLGGSIYYVSDSEENISVLFGDLIYILLVNDDVSDITEIDAHIIRYLHVRVEVKIFGFCSH